MFFGKESARIMSNMSYGYLGGYGLFNKLIGTDTVEKALQADLLGSISAQVYSYYQFYRNDPLHRGFFNPQLFLNFAGKDREGASLFEMLTFEFMLQEIFHLCSKKIEPATVLLYSSLFLGAALQAVDYILQPDEARPRARMG